MFLYERTDTLAQAAAVTLEAKKNNIPVVAQVLHFPSTCHPKFFPRDKYEFGSYMQNHDNPVLGALYMETFLDSYNPNPKPDARHSPLLSESLEGLPPTCKHTIYVHYRPKPPQRM